MESTLAGTRTRAKATAPEPSQARGWLTALARDHRREIALTVAAGSAVGVFTVLLMAMLAWIIHQAIITQVTTEALLPWFAATALVMALRALAQGLQARTTALASHRIRARVRQQLTESWRRAGPVSLKAHSAATLASEWLDQVEALHGYFARFLPQMMLCGLVPILILLVVLSQDWLAAVFLLLSAPLIPLFMALVGMGAERVNQQHFEVLGRLSGQFLDKVRALSTLQLFGATEQAAASLQSRSDTFRSVTMKTLKVAFLSSAVLEFFASVAIAVVAMYIGFGLLGYIAFGPAEELTLFSGLFVLLLAPEFFQPLRQLAQNYHDRAAALGAATLLLGRLDNPAPGVEAPAISANSRTASNDIRLNRVTVCYDPQKPVLDRVNLTIKQGQCLVLQGPSGGGKSTLLNVLAGFVPPNEGTVTVFGQVPGHQPFGWLGQSPYLLQGSWADNLRLVRPNATEQDIHQALALAGLTSQVSARKSGIHSHVSELGQGLSGGQARRLSLARVFLADYGLVLLDEPTAGLDPASQQDIRAALARLKAAGKTLVLASHHDSLLALADQVVRVDNGKIVDG
ncbi:MAG: thiol reductant ABC exporter subunit CydD [Marinobacter sp.]|uniref:thiol reductant ABC exporter subunit CydD n=1 Tax=Marinobacter sp. TaxID=50741 RepID=UPI00299EB7A3|nr:thiol reductant ABC exporter subunit CydD [Marinobacter sp.]MDX1755036.1 thiol reductant ABC exporter subunit CydD [Marinobacter sp.]